VTAPKRNASHDEWAKYAVSQGADPEEAEAASRDDLVAAYGDQFSYICGAVVDEVAVEGSSETEPRYCGRDLPCPVHRDRSGDK
jgi:hypothetical protein